MQERLQPAIPVTYAVKDDAARSEVAGLRLRLVKEILADPLEEILNVSLDDIENLSDYWGSAGRVRVEDVQNMWFAGIRANAHRNQVIAELMEAEDLPQQPIQRPSSGSASVRYLPIWHHWLGNAWLPPAKREVAESSTRPPSR